MDMNGHTLRTVQMALILQTVTLYKEIYSTSLREKIKLKID